ncbi:MAG: AAA family ATPase [Sporichthyaceae bacterium]
MKVPVHSVLFRRLTNSNAEAFLGGNRGEYDLRYGRLPEIADFAEQFAEESPTALGGWTKNLPIEPFAGANPVPATTLRLRFMGPGGARANDTYIASQSSDPYPLWAPKRARPGAAVAEDLVGDVALVVRDGEGRLHARWVRREDVPNLPDGLRQAIVGQEKGIYVVPPSNAAPSPRVQALLEALRRHHNVLLYGPPGTGKTHLVAEVRRHFGGGGLQLDTTAEKGALAEGGGGAVHHAWATFHQSYSYEDFLIGLRPRPIAGGGFDLIPRPGILLELAEWARTPGRSSLLVVDEINRGNVSRIFGEFITLMEPDKRLAEDGTATDQTVEVRLPFVDAGQAAVLDLPDGTQATVPVPFAMPRRVYTLATMNSVDKSVAPLDAALRRRFHVVNLAPQLDEFRTHLGLDDRPATRALVPAAPATRTDARWLGLTLLEVLNRRITYFLGSDFQLGEWFLAPLVKAADDAEALAALAEVWRTAVMPQLEDYFVGRADQLAKTLGDPPKTEPALVVDEPDTGFVELGAVRSLRANPAADDAALLAFMARIVRAVLPAAPESDG